MIVDGFHIPSSLLRLIEAKIWPVTDDHGLKQNRASLVSIEKIKSIAPNEDALHLYRPPFTTIAKSTNQFWQDPWNALHEIDPAKAIMIADFGLGSDTALILDYRPDISNPRVMRLNYEANDNHWVHVAESFDEFVSMIGLWTPLYHFD